jgi:hypothetical protein
MTSCQPYLALCQVFICLSLLDVYRPSKGEVFFCDPVSESVAAGPSRFGGKGSSLDFFDGSGMQALDQLSGGAEK